MAEDSPGREAHGFSRTACGCPLCQAYCRVRPGTLDPEDLARLCPPGQDLLTWAERHLRARAGGPYPALVPARAIAGHCHWYVGGGCSVHADAPYGCAFFDAHMDDAEVARRVGATVAAIRADAAADGPYARVWRHLRDRELVAEGGGRGELAAEARKALRSAERARRRSKG